MFNWLFKKYIRAIESHQKTINQILSTQNEQANLLLETIKLLKTHEDQIKKLSERTKCPWDIL